MIQQKKKFFFLLLISTLSLLWKVGRRNAQKAKKNTTPRNILLQFFLTSKPTYQKNIQIFTSDGSVTWNLGFGDWKCHGETGLRQVEHVFSSLFANLFEYLMIFQNGARQRRYKTLKNHEICQKFGNKMKKSLVQLAI